MGIHTGMILLNIFIICVISIVIVKIYYRKHADADVDINLFGSYKFFTNRTTEDTDKIISENERIIMQSGKSNSHPNRAYANNNARRNVNYRANPNYNQPRNPQSNSNPYALTNKNYNTYKTKEGDIMSQNSNVGKIEKKDIAEKIEKEENNKIVTTDQSTKKETYTNIAETQSVTKDQELKDLFTIDELIKESKRKTPTTPTSQPNTSQTPAPKKEIHKFLTPEERESMKDHVEEMENELNKKAAERKLNNEVKSVETQTVNGVYKHTQSPINSPILKTPRKSENSINGVIKETVAHKIDEFPKEVDQSTKKETYTDIVEAQPRVQDQPINENLFEQASTVDVNNIPIDEDEEEYDDLDYRKDITRLTNRVKNSRIFNDVKNKLKVEPEEEEEYINPSIDEEFLRNVRSYDAPEEAETEVIIPERDFDGFDNPYIEPERQESKKEKAKKLHIQPPKKEELDLKINNNPAKLKKGDEIIFKYHGDTYSSKVFRINGDDISVKFRGQFITIKPSDVKKIF